jgi:hypothetical protein
VVVGFAALATLFRRRLQGSVLNPRKPFREPGAVEGGPPPSIRARLTSSRGNVTTGHRLCCTGARRLGRERDWRPSSLGIQFCAPVLAGHPTRRDVAARVAQAAVPIDRLLRLFEHVRTRVAHPQVYAFPREALPQAPPTLARCPADRPVDYLRDGRCRRVAAGDPGEGRRTDRARAARSSRGIKLQLRVIAIAPRKKRWILRGRDGRSDRCDRRRDRRAPHVARQSAGGGSQPRPANTRPR